MGNKLPREVQEKFSEVELATLREHFHVLAAKEESTTVGVQTFMKYFLKNTPELSKLLWKAFDIDRDGRVGEIDFISGMAVCIKTAEENRIKFVFKILDSNGSGKVTVEDLKKYFPFPARHLPDDLAQAMWDFDKQHAKELSVKKNETVEVVYRHDNTWWLVKNAEGETGYVAATYFKPIKPPPPKAEGWDTLAADNGRVTVEQYLTVAPTAPKIQEIIKEMARFPITPPPAVELGGPSNFRHQAHIGYDKNTGGFVYDDLNDEMKSVLERAGVTKKDVADPATAVFVANIIQQEREKQIKRKMGPPAPSEIKPPPTSPPPALPANVPTSPRGGEPTVPATSPRGGEPTVPAISPRGGRPLPVAPKHEQQPHVNPPPGDVPPPLNKEVPHAPLPPTPAPHVPVGVAPKVPPTSPPPAPVVAPTPPVAPPPPVAPAPEAPKTAGPPPPPKPPLPPPRKSENVGTASTLLDEIRKGKTLNKVNPNEVNLTNVTSEEVDDLAGILKKALDLRRFHIKTEQVQEDEDDGAWDD